MPFGRRFRGHLRAACIDQSRIAAEEKSTSSRNGNRTPKAIAGSLLPETRQGGSSFGSTAGPVLGGAALWGCERKSILLTQFLFPFGFIWSVVLLLRVCAHSPDYGEENAAPLLHPQRPDAIPRQKRKKTTYFLFVFRLPFARMVAQCECVVVPWCCPCLPRDISERVLTENTTGE